MKITALYSLVTLCLLLGAHGPWKELVVQVHSEPKVGPVVWVWRNKHSPDAGTVDLLVSWCTVHELL